MGCCLITTTTRLLLIGQAGFLFMDWLGSITKVNGVLGGVENPMVSDEISSLNVQGDVMIPRVRKCTWILPESWDVVEQRVP